MKHVFSHRSFLLFMWVALIIFARLLPHPPNVTPWTAMAVFVGAHFSTKFSLGSLLLSMLLSNGALSFFYGYPFLGLWSLFTFSALVGVYFFSQRFRLHEKSIIPLGLGTIACSFFFWCWTNGAVWLEGVLYPRTWDGLVVCYTAALPFLRNSLMGDVGYVCLFAFCFSFVQENKAFSFFHLWRKRAL